MFEQLPEFVQNHTLLVLGFAGVSVAIIVNEVSQLTRGYKSISPAELTQLLNCDGLVIDVSAIAEFEKGHILGSKHVALSQLDPESKLLVKVKDLPVAVVCRSGMQSAQSAKRLVKAGFTKVHWLDGGVATWQQAELPLARGKG